MAMKDHMRALSFVAAALVLGACARRMDTSRLAAPPLLAGARQLVVVTTPGWDSTSGSLRRYSRTSVTDAWRADGPAVPVVVGRAGLARSETMPADVAEGVAPKREGDGRSPAGAFPLDTVFGFAPRDSVPWVRLPYVALGPGSECVDDGASVHYNTVVDRATVGRVDWASAERMREVGQYALGVIVGYNATPPRAGRGSCIFLHIWAGPGSTTAGCTAFDAGALESLVRWLDPERRPVLVQMPAKVYDQVRGRWGTP